MFQNKKSCLAVISIYFLFTALMGFYCFVRPLYNWDMLPYTALVLRLDGHSSSEAHTLAYSLVQKSLPADDYRKLTDSNHVYRSVMMTDARAFERDLPFYVIKPLYIGLAYVFYKAGIALPEATRVPSVISYLLIGFLLFYWLRLYLSLPITFLASMLVMTSPPFTEVARLSTPDYLSSLFIAAGLFFIIQKPSLNKAFIFLGLSVFVRPDNIVTCFVVLSFIYIGKNWYSKIPLRFFLLLVALLCVFYLLIGVIANRNGWSIFFYGDFIERLHPIPGSNEGFSFNGYFRSMYEHALSGMKHSHLAIFMLMLVLGLNYRLFKVKLTFDDQFSLLIPFIILIRFVLFPDISDRFNIAFYIVIIVFLVKKLTSVKQMDKVLIE